MIKSEIIKDSVTESGSRITTFVLTYPRFIHSEFMTHRMISKNASSSRAIPVKKQIESVLENPAVPLAFTKNKPGMQGGDSLTGEAEKNAKYVWYSALGYAVKYAQMLSTLEVHKQYANRILEPFSHITVVATATDWANFFALRTHKDAQPEFQELAKSMWKNYSESSPEVLKNGSWHLPFIPRGREFMDKTIKESDLEECKSLASGLNRSELLLRRSVARCARVSYNTHDGKESSLKSDLELYEKLVGSTPIHASPTEHQAMAVPNPEIRSGNLKGWLQYRKTLKNENITSFPGSSEL